MKHIHPSSHAYTYVIMCPCQSIEMLLPGFIVMLQQLLAEPWAEMAWAHRGFERSPKKRSKTRAALALNSAAPGGQKEFLLA